MPTWRESRKFEVLWRQRWESRRRRKNASCKSGMNSTTLVVVMVSILKITMDLSALEARSLTRACTQHGLLQDTKGFQAVVIC